MTSLTGDVQFVDIETTAEVNVSLTASARAQYEQRFTMHQEQLRNNVCSMVYYKWSFCRARIPFAMQQLVRHAWLQ